MGNCSPLFYCMSNEDLHLLALFMNYTITSKLTEEVWYLIEDKFKKDPGVLWQPHKDRKQGQAIINKIRINALTKRYYEFLWDICIYQNGNVELQDAMEMCVKIVKLVNQLKND